MYRYSAIFSYLLHRLAHASISPIRNGRLDSFPGILVSILRGFPKSGYLFTLHVLPSLPAKNVDILRCVGLPSDVFHVGASGQRVILVSPLTRNQLSRVTLVERGLGIGWLGMLLCGIFHSPNLCTSRSSAPVEEVESVTVGHLLVGFLRVDFLDINP